MIPIFFSLPPCLPAKTNWTIGSGQEMKSWLFRSNQIQRGNLITFFLLLSYFLLLVRNLNVYSFKDVHCSPYTGSLINLWLFVWVKLGKISQHSPRWNSFNPGGGLSANPTRSLMSPKTIVHKLSLASLCYVETTNTNFVPEDTS